MNENIERICFSGNRDTLLDSHLVTLGDDDDVIHDKEVTDDWMENLHFVHINDGDAFFIFRGLFNLDNFQGIGVAI